MSKRQELLGDIKYLSHDLNQDLLESAFFEFCCTRLFSPKSRINQIRAKIEQLAESNGHAGVIDTIPVLPDTGDLPALPAAPVKRGRPATTTKRPGQTAQTRLRTEDKRTMEDWRREFFEWALNHGGEVDVAQYRREKFFHDYKDVAYSNTRGSQTMTYMSTTQKSFRRVRDGVYAITDKGRLMAAEMAVGGTGAQPDHLPEPPAAAQSADGDYPDIQLPRKYDKNGPLYRMAQYAHANGGVLDMREFCRSERKATGANLGLGRMLKYAQKSGLFVKTGDVTMRFSAKTAKSMAAHA